MPPLAARLASVLLLGLLTAAVPARAEDVKGRMEEAAKLHQAGKLDQAIALYGKLLAIEDVAPDQRAGILLMRGRALVQKRDFKAAAADYDKALDLAPDNALAYLSRAALKTEQKDFLGALPDLDRVIAIRPDFLPAVVTKARVLAELRRFDDAADTWSRIVALNPKDPSALHQRGVAFSAAGDRTRALRDFDEALMIAPGRPEIHLDRAVLRTNAGDYADALADVEQGILLAPTEAMPYRLRGRIRFQQGDFAGAAADYTAADAADGLKGRRDAFTVLWLHLARLRAGTADAADLRKRLAGIDMQIWPGPVLRFLQGEMKADAVVAAAEASKDAVQRNERLCEAYFYLGQAAIASGQPDEAEDLLRKAIATDVVWFVEWNAARAELGRQGK